MTNPSLEGLEAHYRTWAELWRHRNSGVEITDAELRQRYGEWVEAEETRLTRERKRWQRANWGYPPEPVPVSQLRMPIEQAVKRLSPPVAKQPGAGTKSAPGEKGREKAAPKLKPTGPSVPRPGSVPMP